MGLGSRENALPDSDTSDKGLDDRIFDKESMKSPTGLISASLDINLREEALATGKKK
jgi:hypothetical protein